MTAAPTSPRLGYRRLRHDDLAAFHRLLSDAHVKRYLLDGQDMPRAWVADAIEQSDALFATHGVGLWLLLQGDQAVGFAGFRGFSAMCAEPQLLYALTLPVLGRGLATEAARAMVVAAEAAGMSAVVAAVDAPNLASLRVLDKLDFVVAGHLPGGFGDTLLLERFLGARPARPSVRDAPLRLRLAHTWNGERARPDELVELSLAFRADELVLAVDAPFHGDPDPGTAERLWDHEVVELMLLGDDDRYLEVELSPHGHVLVLQLHGPRHVAHRGLVPYHSARVEGARWLGEVRIPHAWLPPGCARLNAFAMHGAGPGRRYLAWRPPGGPRPDFHRLQSFGAIDGCPSD